MSKFVGDRPFANAEVAARKLLDIVRTSIDDSGLPYAYTGVTNMTFLIDGGNPAEYTAGIKYAASQKWFEVDRSGTRIVTASGRDQRRLRRATLTGSIGAATHERRGPPSSNHNQSNHR